VAESLRPKGTPDWFLDNAVSMTKKQYRLAS
jgi:hypothetical protein